MRFKIKNYLLILVWFLFLGSWSFAHAADGVGLDPSSTLLNARHLGMGGVSLGFANDAGGVFANPAAMTGLDFPQLLAASRKLVFEETQYTLLCWSMPTELGTFGFGYTSLNTGGSIATQRDPATTRIIINPSQEATSFDDNVLALSYSRNIRPDLAVGGALKLFNQTLSGGMSSRASSFGLDLATTYKPLSWLTAAANLQNLLEGSLKWENGATDKIGGFYKLGCKLYILGSSTEALWPYNQQLYGGIDLDIPHSALSSTAYHLGLDYSPVRNIFLRTGLDLASGGSGLAFGIGVVNGGFRFDYAYVQRPGLPGDNPHYFTLSYIGERVLTIDRKLKSKAMQFRVRPHDRYITDRDSIEVHAEVWALRTMDQKRNWTVTAVSATYDAFEVSTRETLATIAFLNKVYDKTDTVEARAELKHGRNAFPLIGYTSPDMIEGKVYPSVVTTAEYRVLRVMPFTDTSMDFWAADPIYLNVTLGLVTGYPDNSFKPDKGITRAELVTLLVRSLGIPQHTLDVFGTTEVFTDVKTNHWAANFIAYGSAVKYVTGYPDGTFKPNKVLSRAEGVTLLARYAGLTEEAKVGSSPFPDLKPEFWANKYIAPAKEAGLLKYLAGKEFNPSAPFPRAEACEVLYQVPDIQKRVNEFWDTGVVSGTPR
jgi:hypothetical protein